MLAGRAITWHSKTQSSIVLSSTEVESYAAIAAAKVCLFVHHFLICLWQPLTGPTIIYEDNEV